MRARAETGSKEAGRERVYPNTGRGTQPLERHPSPSSLLDGVPVNSTFSIMCNQTTGQ